jgi:hypothetical protein
MGGSRRIFAAIGRRPRREIPVRQGPQDWSRAYARQARADLEAREALLDVKFPACQNLHFLQMACEKISKAHLCLGGADPESLHQSHTSAAKVIPLIARELLRRDSFKISRSGSERTDHTKLSREIAKLAREIELLAPSVKDSGRRPDNCEYPWEDAAGALLVPAEHDFTYLNGLHRYPAGLTFLKMITVAASELETGSYFPS